jgi:hypothetical protein
MENSEKQILKPISLGLIVDPPMLVLSYDVVLPSSTPSTSRSRRKRKMPLRGFSDRSNVQRTAFALRQRHETFLQLVPAVTIEKMLRIVQEILKGSSKGMSNFIPKLSTSFYIAMSTFFHRPSHFNRMQRILPGS